jgi:UDP-N-acetylmuramoylalanine--D-glutamate ligase
VTSAERVIDPDALTLDGVVGGALRDRAITVLGFARSGIALARFLADRGAAVTVYDGRSADELATAISALDDRDIRLMLGPDVEPADALRGAALVATSPSINPDYPTTEPRLRATLRALVDARAADDLAVPAIVSEADLFLRLCPAPTVGVTGTKGKTTTSALTATILAADPSHPAVLGGNIGTPLIERLPELTPEHRVVIELSELQLPTLSRGTTVAVYTNVTADHLDRHGSLEAYRRVKHRLAELVPPEGALVINADDPVVSSYAVMGRRNTVAYRQDPPTTGEVGIVDGWITANEVRALSIGDSMTPRSHQIMRVGDLRIPGQHNVSNAMAAVAVGLLFGLEPAAIRAAASSFRGVEHRLEVVTTIGGIRYVNDSQGTQPDAVVAALHAFDPPIVLIAGGRGKDLDYGPLPDVVADRASAAVLIGETGPDLASRFRQAGLARTIMATSMDDAVRIARDLARDALASTPNRTLATVLLSPAAASFDMFRDYEDRGRAFKAAVARLEEGSR